MHPMKEPTPSILDVRFVQPERVGAVVNAAINRLAPGGRVVVICDREAVVSCRAAVNASEETSWDVLETPPGSTYARITRTR
jgi:uncharacterized protein (DUF2249 family)